MGAGDEYVKALSNSLLYSENFETIDLSGNRLSNDGVNKLFKIINENKKLVRNLKTKRDLSGYLEEGDHEGDQKEDHDW